MLFLQTMFCKRVCTQIAVVFTLLSLNGLAQVKENLDAKAVAAKMVKSIKEVDGLKYNLKITERGRKGYNHYESAVKLNRKPRMLYIYIKGIEVLWTVGTNNGKALVKPNSFPYINLNLDPMGTLMRQDQHHTINEMGFDYFGGIIEYCANKLGDKVEQYFSLEGEERWNNRPCYKLVINNKDFAYTNYTVGENESITSIARKLFVSEYMIVELNPKFKDYFDILKKGQVIKVPNWYAKNVTIYVDQLYFLPIGVKVFDDKSLYEEYNYFFLQVNPTFEKDEFTRDFKGYKF
jgi:outer membrane lipoprotein-sorting protein